MTDITTGQAVPVTATASMSWYLPPTHPLLVKSAGLVDAVTVKGPKGPSKIRKMREAGFDCPVVFDGCGYDGQGELPPATDWVRAQANAKADRLLMPGIYIPDGESSDLARAVKAQDLVAQDLGASNLFALDSRWVAKQSGTLLDILLELRRPVCLVLADPRDPLARKGAVPGLRLLSCNLPDLSVLRCDHGAIGALAFGARHASIGLATSNRHFGGGPMRAHKKSGGGARVFVRPLLDWFLAADIAGWSAAGDDNRCYHSCCGGASLARFLDEDENAVWHNMCALADFSDVIWSVNEEDRASEFLAECRKAAIRYDLAEFHGPQGAKAQLTGWALS